MGKSLFKAIQSYKTAINLDVNHADAHFNLAEIKLNQGEIEEALSSCRTAVTLDGTDVRKHFNFGTLLEQVGDLIGAVDAYTTALEIDPTFQRTYTNLGGVHARLGDLDEASRLYKKALDLDPTDGFARFNLERLPMTKLNLENGCPTSSMPVFADGLTSSGKLLPGCRALGQYAHLEKHFENFKGEQLQFGDRSGARPLASAHVGLKSGFISATKSRVSGEKAPDGLQSQLLAQAACDGGSTQASSSPAGSGSSGYPPAVPSTPLDVEVTSLCVICMERSPSWVFQACGHLCVCKPCARKQKQKKTGLKTGGDKSSGSRNSQPRMFCPVCRTETAAVPSSRHAGTVYES